MPKTSVEVDHDILREVAVALGTKTMRQTINAALLEVLESKRRLEVIHLLSEEGRFDFSAAEDAWGGSK